MQPEMVEKVSFEATEAIFAKTNCLECAKCCKGYNPIVQESDIYRMAEALSMQPATFASTYLILDEEDEWCINGSPCPFLAADNKCRIYAFRPDACADYPHMSSPNLAQREELTRINATICPAVEEILQTISQKIDIER